MVVIGDNFRNFKGKQLVPLNELKSSNITLYETCD
jgi:hypothetical protein